MTDFERIDRMMKEKVFIRNLLLEKSIIRDMNIRRCMTGINILKESFSFILVGIPDL